MAIPWQTDTASCRDGYTSSYDPYVPTFWPARVPNNILDEARYHETMDPNLSEETRRLAFAYRAAWLNDLPLDGQAPNYTNQINSMIKYFDKLAIVQPRPGVPGNPYFPAQMQVGIVPNAAQDQALLEASMAELQGIIDRKGASPATRTLLGTVVDHLSTENLLNEQDLVSTAKDQLEALAEHMLETDFKSTPAVQKLLKLLATKEPKPATVKPELPKKVGAGVRELDRFTNFVPDTRN
jgi:hypothetical protein